MKIRLFILSLFLTVICYSQNKGTITGTLTDKEVQNETLPFANVIIKGTKISTVTDINGKYTLLADPGNYTIQFSFVGYEPVETPITVVKGQTIVVNKALGSGGYKLEDVVIKTYVNKEKETALLLEQKNAVEIKQSIGAQEMSRKGVSDVEEGLTKVTGIVKVDGRGLFVRGLEDRYNNLMINGLQAPSNSPYKKIIPTDLFPTDIVGVLNIYKTFNPEISGDFAGATINIETSQPKNSITKISAGVSYVTNNNGQKFLLAEEANTNKGFFGFIGTDKKLPSYFGEKPSGYSQTPSQYNDYNKNSNWNVDSTTSPINTSFSILHADKINVGKGSNQLSYLFNLNQGNSYQIQRGAERTFNFGQGNYDNNFMNTTYEYINTISSLVNIKFKTTRYDLSFNSFLLKNTSSKIQDQLGYTNSQTTRPNVIIRMNQFEETQYWNNQILGNYNITEDKKHTLNGGFSYVNTSFGQPDRKFLVGELNGDQITSTYGGNNLIRQYLDISGKRFFSGKLEYNFIIKTTEDDKDNKISVGYNGFSNEEVSSYRFVVGKPISNSIPAFTTDINKVDSEINNAVENGNVRFTENSNEDYKSKLYQNIQSGYFNLFWNFGSKVEVNGGLRAEKSLREIKFRRLGDGLNSNFSVFSDDKLDLLPAVNAKLIVNDKSNFRLAISKTLTRPASAELLPIEYINSDGTSVLGNYPLATSVYGSKSDWRSLKNTDNYNIDLKYEIFPENNELIAIGVFGKQIQNPIERIFIQSASSGGQITTFDNSKTAKIFGAELELLLGLNRISKYLENVSWGFNTSIMQTQVEVDLVKNPAENSSTRELQGAAKWVINTDLKYDFTLGKEIKNTATLVFGVTADRIYAVGTSGLDHIYEKPFNKLDFVWTAKLSKNIETKLSVDNILNQNFRRVLGNDSKNQIYENDLTVKQFKKGTGFGFNISYTF